MSYYCWYRFNGGAGYSAPHPLPEWDTCNHSTCGPKALSAELPITLSLNCLNGWMGPQWYVLALRGWGTARLPRQPSLIGLSGPHRLKGKTMETYTSSFLPSWWRARFQQERSSLEVVTCYPCELIWILWPSWITSLQHTAPILPFLAQVPPGYPWFALNATAC